MVDRKRPEITVHVVVFFASRVKGQIACGGHEHTNAKDRALTSLAEYSPKINKGLAKAARWTRSAWNTATQTPEVRSGASERG